MAVCQTDRCPCTCAEVQSLQSAVVSEPPSAGVVRHGSGQCRASSRSVRASPETSSVARSPSDSLPSDLDQGYNTFVQAAFSYQLTRTQGVYNSWKSPGI